MTARPQAGQQVTVTTVIRGVVVDNPPVRFKTDDPSDVWYLRTPAGQTYFYVNVPDGTQTFEIQE